MRRTDRTLNRCVVTVSAGSDARRLKSHQRRVNPLPRILTVVDHEGQIFLVSQMNLLVNYEVGPERNCNVSRVFDIRQ